jgi:hypothetical protein
MAKSKVQSEDKEKTTFYLSGGILKKLRIRCATDDVTLSRFVEDALIERLKNKKLVSE